MLRKLFKEVPQVLDRIRVTGGSPRKAKFRGIRMEDGSPVPVGVIQKQFGVDLARAEQIAARMTR